MRTIYNRQVLTLISVIMFTAILVLVSALAVSGTVLCQSSQAGKEQWVSGMDRSRHRGSWQKSPYIQS